VSLAARLRAGPDPDLEHLPVSLDLRAISAAEGLRAALAVAALVALNEWLHIPALGQAGLGALLTCLCDPGGPIRSRVPALLTFTILGAIAVAGFSLLRTAGIVPAAVGGSAWIACAMFARSWGPGPMQVGNLLTVVAVLALDRPAGPAAAIELAALFACGSLWALLLTLVIWRVHPFRPARTAVAEVYRRLGVLAGDLSEQLAERANPDWAAHARGHRRYVRDGIELARTEVLAVLRTRGQGGPRGNNLLIQLEAGDQIFGAVIALSDVLEHGEAAARAEIRPALPALRILLAAIADAIFSDRTQDESHRSMFERLLAEIDRAQQETALAGVTQSLLQRLRVAALMTTPEGQAADGGRGAGRGPLLARFVGPLRSNLRWSSAALRHAVRATVVAGPALLITLSAGQDYAHWLTITLVLTLQPFFALTWQRALERVGGTVVGGVLAAVIAAFVHSPLATAALLFPLAITAFAVRRVSFGLFMAALTPMVVLLSELGQPGTSEFTIAAFRALYTLAGGATAVLGGLLLWPSWEPARVLGDLGAAIRAHAAYADSELAVMQGEIPAGSADAARRMAGLASNNLETTLSRALQEPGHDLRRELQAAMLADAALRRIAGRLAALEYAPGLADAARLDVWRAWLADSFAILARGERIGTDPPEDSPHGTLGRIARQMALIDGALH